MRSLHGSLAGLGLLTVACSIGATGFFVNQQDVRATGRVNAGAAAAADDASTAFFNPAGLTRLLQTDGPSARTRISGHLNVVIPKSAQTDGGSTVATPATGGQPVRSGGTAFKDPAAPTPVPTLYVAHRFEAGPAIGLAINAPFGQAGRFDSAWFGRYDTIEVELQTLNISFVVAMPVGGGLSVGGGLDVQGGRSRLVAAIPDPLASGGPSPATDGRSVTRGDGWATGFNLGALFEVTEATHLGVSYRSGINHRFTGRVETTGLVGPLAAANGTLDATARFRLPDIVGVGLVHRPSSETTLYAQYDWFGWSRFDKVRVELANGARLERPQRYRDAWAASLGVDQRLTGRIVGRAGVRFDRTPTRDGDRDAALPDANRLWLATGASFRIHDAWSLDLAANHVSFRGAAVDTTRTFFDGTPLATVARVRGNARSHVNTFSIGASRAF